jgi:SAM-dependent methyltransferase
MAFSDSFETRRAAKLVSSMDYRDYYEFRKADPESFLAFSLPAFIKGALGKPLGQRVLDFGCGLGQMTAELCKAGYVAEGLDVSPYAIAHCRSLGLVCHEGEGESFYEEHQSHYDYVIMGHVLEHFPKEEVIPLLSKLRGLLKPGGGLIVMVPNAQSHTGAYWAFEDFTHYMLFTSGSLYYVLRSAGFSTVEFLDPDVTEGLAFHKKLIKKFFLMLYRLNYRFWNRITSSTTHRPSPDIFSFEVKALARR